MVEHKSPLDQRLVRTIETGEWATRFNARPCSLGAGIRTLVAACLLQWHSYHCRILCRSWAHSCNWGSRIQPSHSWNLFLSNLLFVSEKTWRREPADRIEDLSVLRSEAHSSQSITPGAGTICFILLTGRYMGAQFNELPRRCLNCVNTSRGCHDAAIACANTSRRFS